jgi:hypothetical protein
MILDVRFGLALFALVLTSCSSGSTSRNLPIEADGAVRQSATIARSAELPHIFAPTIQYLPHDGGQYDRGMFKFDQEGNELVFPALFTAGVDGNLTFDTHNDTLYYLTGYDPITVAAVDQQGNPKTLIGKFGHYDNRDSAASITFDSKNDLLYVQFSTGIEAFDEEGRPHPIAGSGEPPIMCGEPVSMLYDPHADAFYRWLDCGARRGNARVLVQKLDDRAEPIGGTGNFGAFHDAYDRIFSMTYDANDGLIYVQGIVKGALTRTQILAFDEAGDAVPLSPGFPPDLGAGDIAYDAVNATMYVAGGRVEPTGNPGEFTYGTTIAAWTDQGVPLPLSGHFDYPRSRIRLFVIAP